MNLNATIVAPIGVVAATTYVASYYDGSGQLATVFYGNGTWERGWCRLLLRS